MQRVLSPSASAEEPTLLFVVATQNCRYFCYSKRRTVCIASMPLDEHVHMCRQVFGTHLFQLDNEYNDNLFIGGRFFLLR